MNKLDAAIATYTTPQIEAAIRKIGLGKVDRDMNLVRLKLAVEYENRLGEDAYDALMISMRNN